MGFAPEDLPWAMSVYGRRHASNVGPFLRVRVPSFALDVRSVTRGEFLRFVWDIADVARAPARKISFDFWRWFDRHVLYDDDLPIVGATYDEAAIFAWFHGGRLPWMYEWELAARGRTGRVLGPRVDQVSTTSFDDVQPFEERVLAIMGFITKRDPMDPWQSPYGIERLVGWVDEWVEGIYYDAGSPAAKGNLGFPGYHWEYEMIVSRCRKLVSAEHPWPHPGARGSGARELWFGRDLSRSPTAGFRCAYNLK